MTYQEIVYEIQAVNPRVVPSQMFGMPTVKNEQGKAMFGDFNGDMVFKLGDEVVMAEAMKIEGAHLFDPMGGRPMKQWVVIPAVQSGQWLKFAEKSLS